MSGISIEPAAFTQRKCERLSVDRRQSSDEQLPDELLLSEFLNGDEAAFKTLVSRYANDLHQFVARFVRNAAAADDIVQDTFIQVHQSAGGFDASRRFRPWLFTIAANKARDHLRGRTRKKEVPLSVGGGSSADGEQISYLDFTADDGDAPDAAMESEEQRQIVRDVVSKLPDNLREILVLGYYQRYPYKEIAEIVGIPLGTVKSRLHAAVSHFAAAYKREIEKRTRDQSGK